MPILQGDQKYLCEAINCLHCKLNKHIKCTNEKFDTIFSNICFKEDVVTIENNVEITRELQGTTGTFSNKLTTNELCATSGNFTGVLQGTTGTFTKVITNELCATSGNFDTVYTNNIFDVTQIYSISSINDDPGIQFCSFGGVRFNSDVSVDKKLTTDELCATSGNFTGVLQGTTGTFSNKLTTDKLCATSGDFTGELQGTIGTFSNKLTTNELCATSGNFTDKVNIQELYVTGTTNLLDELQGTTGTFSNKLTTDKLCATSGNFIGELQGTTGTFTKVITDELCATSGIIEELQGTTGTFTNKLTTDKLCATSGNFTDKVNIQELCITGTTNLLDELQGTTGTFTKVITDQIFATSGTIDVLQGTTGTFTKVITDQICITGSSGTISIENVDNNIIYRQTEGSTGIGIAGPCVKTYTTFTPTGGASYIDLYEDTNVSFYWDNSNKQPCYVLHKTPSGLTGSINDYVSVSTNVISIYTNEPHSWVGTNYTGVTGYFGWISSPTGPSSIYEHSFYGSRTEAMLSSFSNYLDYPLYKLTVKTGNVDFNLSGETGSGFAIIEVFKNF